MYWLGDFSTFIWHPQPWKEFPFKLSRDITEITPLWETPSLQPFLKTYWLTPVNDWPIVAKHANMTSSRGSINAAPATIRQNLFLHLAEPRLWLKMLQLTVKVRSFEGRPHGCSSAAFRWVWHFLKVVRLPSDQRWTFGTQVMSSCRLRSAFLSPSNLQDRTSARLLTPPFHGGAESRGQMREQRDLTSPQMLHGRTHCVSMQPPPQSGVLLFAKHNRSSLIHMIIHSRDNSPSLAATVCSEHPLITW